MAVEKRLIYFICNGVLAICGLLLIIFGFKNQSIRGEFEAVKMEKFLEEYQSKTYGLQCISSGFFLILMACLGIYATLTEKIIIHKIISVFIALCTVSIFIQALLNYSKTPNSQDEDKIRKQSGTVVLEMMKPFYLPAESNYFWTSLLMLPGMIVSGILVFVSFFK